GTTTPGAKFEVDLATNNDGILVNQTTASKQAYITFADQGTWKWQIGKQTSNDFYMYDFANSRNFLQVGGGNVALAPAGGNGGIGTTRSSTALDVSGTARVLASVEGAATSVNSSTAYTIPDVAKNIRRITLDSNTTLTLPVTTSIPTDAAYSLTIRIKQD